MKRIFILTVCLLAVSSLMGCGSATEVGNPTGELPTIRIVKGTIDLSSIVDVSPEIDADKTFTDLDVDPAALSVVAIPFDFSREVRSPLGTDGSFSLELSVDETYSLELQMNGETIGDFSFEQNSMGARANRLRITEAGEPIDLGQVRYQGGNLYPENEPRHQHGVQMSSEYDDADPPI